MTQELLTRREKKVCHMTSVCYHLYHLILIHAASSVVCSLFLVKNYMWCWCWTICYFCAGNEFFKQQKYPEAVKHYTEALRRNPKDPRVICWTSFLTCINCSLHRIIVHPLIYWVKLFENINWYNTGKLEYSIWMNLQLVLWLLPVPIENYWFAFFLDEL